MKTKKYTTYLISAFILFFFIIAPLAVRADGLNQDINIPNPFNCGDKSGATTNCDLLSLITAVLNKIILPIAAVGAVMYIIFAGFQYVQAKGNPGDIEKAHARLLWTLIGVGVLLGAVGISEVLQKTVQQFLTK